MGSFFRVRIGQMVPVIIVVTVVVFSLLLLVPGDIAVVILGEQSSEDARAALREQLGLDQPIYVQYLRWAWNALQFDFGRSLKSHELVQSMLMARVPVTLQLTAMAMMIGIAVGVPLGIVSVIYKRGWVDMLISLIGLSSLAIPGFWLSILLIKLFSLNLRWLPPSGYVPLLADPIESLRYMLLPSLSLGLGLAALVMRQTRTSMLQSMSEDFIRTARAKGLSPLVVTMRHGLRNALIPVVTVIGLQTGTLIGGAVVAETVFAMPGLGRMIVDGVFSRDFPTVQGALLVVVALVLAVNIVVDFVYFIIDPRIRFQPKQVNPRQA